MSDPPDIQQVAPPAPAETGDARESRLRRWLTRVSRPALAIYWPTLVYLTHMPESEAINAVLKPVERFNPDKFLHFGTFVLLTVLIVFAAPLGRRASYTSNLAVGCLVAVVYALLDEMTQAPFGRTASGADVSADLLAVSTVYLVLMLTHASRRSTPWLTLMARVVFAALLPLSGVFLFTPRFGIEKMPLIPRWLPKVGGDHVAHFVAALAVTLLIAAAAPCGIARRRANAWLTFGGMLVAGPIIEWMQATFFKRSAEWEDLIGHTLGVLVAAAAWRWISGRGKASPTPTM